MNKQEIEKAIDYFKNAHIDYSNVESGVIAERVCNLAISALTQQLNDGWIPVSSGRLPKSEERVFICADRKRYDRKIVQIRTTAMYEDGTMRTDDSGFSWEDCEFEYDEESNDYIIPEGWYEQNMYCEEFGIVDDFVTHWQPLPKPWKETV
ncbi:MAG TPA: hypothetical protein VJZ06_04950 [Mobilitalea sp.]|nr:hypothetical protein [Mobilitalea sp.]